MNLFLPFPWGWDQPEQLLGDSPLGSLVAPAREPRHWISLPVPACLHVSLCVHMFIHGMLVMCMHVYISRCVHIGVYKYMSLCNSHIPI